MTGEWPGQRLHLGDRAGDAGDQHGRAACGRSGEVAIVVVPPAVSAVLICVTIVDTDLDLLAFSGDPSLSEIIPSVAPTFFAYLGFSVITSSVGDLRDPRRLPKAMYLALGVTSAPTCRSRSALGTLMVDEVTASARRRS